MSDKFFIPETGKLLFMYSSYVNYSVIPSKSIFFLLRVAYGMEANIIRFNTCFEF